MTIHKWHWGKLLILWAWGVIIVLLAEQALERTKYLWGFIFILIIAIVPLVLSVITWKWLTGKEN
jgi:hypothetical protein